MGDLPVRAHSSLGASSAHRWMPCPGSVAASDGIPDVESDYAREGTAAHAVGEQSLILGTDPSFFLGEVMDGIRVDEDMVEAVSVYTNYIKERMALPSFRKMLVEERVNLDPLEPPRPMFGTCDCVLIFDGFIEVVDYKHGIGLFVEVVDNPQAMYYALGYLFRYLEENPDEDMPSPIVLTIAQPRIPSEKGLVRSITMTPEELLEWGRNTLMPAAQATIDSTERNPGEKQCRWCKAAPACPALKQVAVSTAQEEFGVLPAPELLTVDQMSEVLDRAATIKVWMKAVEEHAHREATNGREIPGFKLVQKRARKKWKEGHDRKYAMPMANLLGTRPQEITEMVSPAKYIKITGIDPSDHYEQVSSGTNLVPETAPGVPVKPTAEEEFTTVDGENK